MPSSARGDRSARGLLPLVAVTLVLTALLGTALRLDLASGEVTALGLDFGNLRHAHSHLGFYGFLTLVWWLVLRARDAFVWPGWLPPLHLGVVAASTVLFAASGYVASTIALSTVVAASWLFVAWRSRRARGWLALAPWGVLAGTLLVPAIAVMARRDFALSRQLAHVFVALMVLWVFVPMSLAALRLPIPTSSAGARRAAPWAWLVTTGLGSTYLVFADTWPFALGLFLGLGGALILVLLARARSHLASWPLSLSLAWLLFALGLVALSLAPPLQIEATRLAALHFTVLGPIALTALHHLAPERARRRAGVVVFGLVGLVTMSAAMVLGPLGAVSHGLAMDLALGAAIAVVLAIVAVTLPLRPRAAG